MKGNWLWLALPVLLFLRLYAEGGLAQAVLWTPICLILFWLVWGPGFQLYSRWRRGGR